MHWVSHYVNNRRAVRHKRRDAKEVVLPIQISILLCFSSHLVLKPSRFSKAKPSTGMLQCLRGREGRSLLSSSRKVTLRALTARITEVRE